MTRMVQNLQAAFEKECIDMTALKPNHFANLSVYFANLIRTERFFTRVRNGRYCAGWSSERTRALGVAMSAAATKDVRKLGCLPKEIRDAKTEDKHRTQVG